MNNPELYNKTNGLSRSAAIHFLDEYAPKMKWMEEGGRIIDLGCGDGSVTRIMIKYIPSNYALISCDVNKKMVQYAREHCAEDNVIFRVQDAEGDLAEELRCAFNHMFSFFLFHFIRNQEKGFSNVYDLLKNGGDCLLTVVKYSPVYELFELVARDRKWSNSWLSDLTKFISPYYYEEEPENVITAMLESTGFINIEVQRKQITYILENGTELKNFIRAVEPYDMPVDVFEEFLQDSVSVARGLGLLDEADKTFDDHDQPIDYNHTLLVIYARKPK